MYLDFKPNVSQMGHNEIYTLKCLQFYGPFYLLFNNSKYKYTEMKAKILIRLSFDPKSKWLQGI